MTTMRTGYTYNPIENTLTLTEAFAKRAGILHSDEYEIVRKLRMDNPGMTIHKADKKSTKHSPMKLSFKQMEEYIGKCRDAETRLARFEQVKGLSKIQPSPYKYVKTWFLDNYANYSEQPVFDADNFVIVKTKSQMEDEVAAPKEVTEENAQTIELVA